MRQAFWPRVCAALFLILLVSFVSPPHILAAETVSEQQRKIDELRKKNQEEFEAWRRSIPDYELRLYNRVKDINSRVVDTRKLVVVTGILVILTIALTIFVWLSTRRRLRLLPSRIRGTSPNTADPVYIDSENAITNAETIDRIESRQRKIFRILSNIEGAFQSRDEDAIPDEKFRVELERLVRDCREIYKGIESNSSISDDRPA